mmetsp:Transcript_2055/g.4288  ORF Transcript_2055/g.4288 Transcript_2055/m.4288 type:complete len:238 (-) Transcript_2055:63-776(-)
MAFSRSFLFASVALVALLCFHEAHAVKPSQAGKIVPAATHGGMIFSTIATGVVATPHPSAVAVGVVLKTWTDHLKRDLKKQNLYDEQVLPLCRQQKYREMEVGPIKQIVTRYKHIAQVSAGEPGVVLKDALSLAERNCIAISVAPPTDDNPVGKRNFVKKNMDALLNFWSALFDVIGDLEKQDVEKKSRATQDGTSYTPELIAELIILAMKESKFKKKIHDLKRSADRVAALKVTKA